jgi:hypothetical protein
LNYLSIPEESLYFSFYLLLHILLFFLKTSFYWR